MTQKKSDATRKGRSGKKPGSVFSKAKNALTNTVKALAGADTSDADETAAATAKAAPKAGAKGRKPKARAAAKPKANTKSKAKPRIASKAKPKRAPKAEKPKSTTKPASKARPAKAKDKQSTSTPTATDPQVNAPMHAATEAAPVPDNAMDAMSRVENRDAPVKGAAPIAEGPPPVLREVPTLKEHVFPTPSRFQAFAMAPHADKSDLGSLPTEGANGRFRFEFVYNGMHFIVQVLGKNARGLTLFLEGNLGFVPFSYEGQGLRFQLLEVLQFAHKQKVVHINLVAEQRISLTSEILIKGPFNPNTAISAVAARLARVKPLIDVIRSLQPYQREYSDGLSHYALERTSVDDNAGTAA